jgi:hypothetical protein
VGLVTEEPQIEMVLLGTFAVRAGAGFVTPRSRLHRTMLAALALAPPGGLRTSELFAVASNDGPRGASVPGEPGSRSCYIFHRIQPPRSQGFPWSKG